MQRRDRQALTQKARHRGEGGGGSERTVICRQQARLVQPNVSHGGEINLRIKRGNAGVSRRGGSPIIADRLQADDQRGRVQVTSRGLTVISLEQRGIEKCEQGGTSRRAWTSTWWSVRFTVTVPSTRIRREAQLPASFMLTRPTRLGDHRSGSPEVAPVLCRFPGRARHPSARRAYGVRLVYQALSAEARRSGATQAGGGPT